MLYNLNVVQHIIRYRLDLGISLVLVYNIVSYTKKLGYKIYFHHTILILNMPCTFKRINIIESTYPYPILKYKSRVVFFVGRNSELK